MFELPYLMIAASLVTLAVTFFRLRSMRREHDEEVEQRREYRAATLEDLKRVR